MQNVVVDNSPCVLHNIYQASEIDLYLHPSVSILLVNFKLTEIGYISTMALALI